MSNSILRKDIKINLLLIQVYKKNNELEFKGKFGLLFLHLPSYIKLEIKYDLIILKSEFIYKSFLNLYISLIKRNIKGVMQCFKKKIYLSGLGYKFILQTNSLILKVGFSHDIIINIPKTIKIFLSNKSMHLTLIGANYHELTQFTDSIRRFKKPEPYKGKGIFLKNEKMKKKEGKKKK